MKHKKKLFLAGSLLSGATAGYMYISKRLFLGALTNEQHLSLGDTTDYGDLGTINNEAIKEWLPTIYHDHAYLKSFDDLVLHAHVFKKENIHKWVIVIHGYKSNSQALMGISKQFYENGYNVLLVDNRAHGLSEGTYIGMGWLDRLDIKKWIDYLIKEDPLAKIALYGVSMGGAAVMMSVGEELPSQVVCAIEDCGYTSASDIILKQAHTMYPGFFIDFLLQGFTLYCKKYAKYAPTEASAIEQLKKSKVPMLFLHGDKDTFVPFEMAYQNYEACASEKELHIIKDQGHALACLDPEYFSIVSRFLTKYMTETS